MSRVYSTVLLPVLCAFKAFGTVQLSRNQVRRLYVKEKVRLTPLCKRII
jgi:hypothetical protein